MTRGPAPGVREAMARVDAGEDAAGAAQAEGIEVKALKRALYNRTYTRSVKALPRIVTRADARAVVEAAGLPIWKVNITAALALLTQGLSAAAAARKLKGN